MKESIWQVNDNKGNKLGLIKVPSYLDIIDVTLRAKSIYGKDSNWMRPIYIGNL